ncbi:MAG: Fur family transcriptional regulator [Acidimicrobiia bacterium]
MAQASLHRQVEGQLNAHEVRYTKGRRTVVTALAEGDGPRSAAELSDQIGPTVPLSSLYRTLAVLEDANVVAPHFATKGLARYELAEWLTGHHHHLVCIECGTVEDVEVSADHEAQVTALVESIAAPSAFTATNHALEIEGTCKACA